MPRKWFITGASKGFGRHWAEEALERGDTVVATARDISTLQPLVAQYGDRVLPLQLDVTDRERAFAVVAEAAEKVGLDIVVNNAGYGHFGAVEEISEDEARNQIETNLFGALWVTQAALPFLREQGHGHIIQVSSIGGISAFHGLGIYHASKWALEGFSQTLAAEVADFGIKVTLVEPTGYSTDWGDASSVNSAPLAPYDYIREWRSNARATMVQGDPVATREAIMKVVDAEEPPLRVFFGKMCLDIATADYEKRLATWREWNDVSLAAHGG